MKSILFGNSAVSIGDAIYITIISMSIVFFILFLISFVLSFFKYFSNLLKHQDFFVFYSFKKWYNKSKIYKRSKILWKHILLI